MCIYLAGQAQFHLFIPIIYFLDLIEGGLDLLILSGTNVGGDLMTVKQNVLRLRQLRTSVLQPLPDIPGMAAAVTSAHRYTVTARVR